MAQEMKKKLVSKTENSVPHKLVYFVTARIITHSGCLNVVTTRGRFRGKLWEPYDSFYCISHVGSFVTQLFATGYRALIDNNTSSIDKVTLYKYYSYYFIIIIIIIRLGECPHVLSPGSASVWMFLYVSEISS